MKRALERGAADARSRTQPEGRTSTRWPRCSGSWETAESASGGPLSGAGRFSARAVLERAVARGVQSGVIAETAISFLKGMAYRRRRHSARNSCRDTVLASGSTQDGRAHGTRKIRANASVPVSRYAVRRYAG